MSRLTKLDKDELEWMEEEQMTLEELLNNHIWEIIDTTGNHGEPRGGYGKHTIQVKDKFYEFNLTEGDIIESNLYEWDITGLKEIKPPVKKPAKKTLLKREIKQAKTNMDDAYAQWEDDQTIENDAMFKYHEGVYIGLERALEIMK